MVDETDFGTRRTRDAARLERAQEVIRRIITGDSDNPSLVSRIACEIGAEIIDNVRLPGDDLNSVDLAKQYQTSRTPVREALMLLEKEGLVTIPPRRRPRVTGLSLPEVREIYAARTAMLQLVAVQVAQEVDDAGIASLRDVLEVMRAHCEAGDIEQYLWANIEYQERHTEVARNKTAKRILDSILLRTVRQRRMSLSQPHRMRASFGEHELLQKFYEARDANLAAAVIRSNYNNAMATLERLMSQRPELCYQSEEGAASDA